jgi:superfamily II DNA or RNA helicase
MRIFSKNQRIAAELVEGRTGEMDHITPYSKGGQTVIENSQILSPSMNKKKGAFNFVPRKWQEEFIEQWGKRPEGCPFLLVAIPGSGKTMAALEVARQWMQAGTDRRVIVVVPSSNLRTQWSKEAARFGIELQTKEFGTNFKHGFQGGVTTYHTVANSRMLFRKLCSVAPTLVIFDEIHHCGEETHFGEGIKEAFELAKEKLSMSGTPWKTDGKPIPFIMYDGNGYALADYRYDYPNALTDEVVRCLVFDHAKGSLTNDITGETLDLTGEISEKEAAFRLRRLLDAEGEYVRKQIEDAHRKLIECRKTVPDAGCLAVCIDQFHAAKVASVIQDVTGCEPSVIVSDDEIENDTVESFRRSKTEWLVSVKKVSEGTDIKRLQVLCYLTNVTSELFFRQVIGRVSRVRNMEDYEGYVYIPADPRLIACAKNIENAQVLAIKEQAERELRELEKREMQIEFTSYTTSHEGSVFVMIGNEQVDVHEAREIERVAEQAGLSMQKVREVRNLFAITNTTPVVSNDSEVIVTKEDRCMKLRIKCDQKVKNLARMTGKEYWEIHRQFSLKPQKEMSERELKDKLAWVNKEIINYERN